MKIAILGTGAVGTTIATKLIELGHQVMIGSRSKTNEKAIEFVNKFDKNASNGTFEEAATFGEIIFNCVKGEFAIEALKQAGSGITNKILIDVSIPVDTKKGTPLSLIPELCNTNSLGEEIQKTFPNTKVVKTLNTMWSTLMIVPTMLQDGDHTNFICGNDEEAKNNVKSLLKEIGWKEQAIMDLGDITGSRGTEGLMPLWLRIWGATMGTFSIKVVN
ncbi:NAD(P)-binding domain-containing protein [Flavobacterium granuli]|uniref:Dinucleotide-binding enzyme n=1 Tax=Flavobacterium granuli TaxID=280093 RepID=A0ABU1S485_9FLAO|nr:NAD(P)-binding domain-containing protein [Flavobacterium granuli]MDR6845827.1 putative dinucleotide-binding enzyme [Flavobacterium granuli]